MAIEGGLERSESSVRFFAQVVPGIPTTFATFRKISAPACVDSATESCVAGRVNSLLVRHFWLHMGNSELISMT